MSKRKVEFEEQVGVAEHQKQKIGDDSSRRFKEKHSLDSDEEDEENEEVMNQEDIEGQEEGTVDFDEGIKITPFNMNEELEEGHFDKDGTYIFDKNKEQIRDEWMDNIDWVKIKEQEKGAPVKDEDDDDSDDEAAPLDKHAIYREMLVYVNPGETVAKALQRLGKTKGKPMSSSERWKAKKKGMSLDGDETARKAKEDFLKLTGLADQLLSSGDMDIYECTNEKLNYELKQKDAKKGSRVDVPENLDDDDALDMFADDFDSKEAEKSNIKPETSESKNGTASGEVKASPLSDEVMWEYKWENKDREEIHGPHSSSEMLKWTEDGYFPKGVFVRKVGVGGDFYSSRRIDFDLYT